MEFNASGLQHLLTSTDQSFKPSTCALLSLFMIDGTTTKKRVRVETSFYGGDGKHIPLETEVCTRMNVHLQSLSQPPCPLSVIYSFQWYTLFTDLHVKFQYSIPDRLLRLKHLGMNFNSPQNLKPQFDLKRIRYSMFNNFDVLLETRSKVAMQYFYKEADETLHAQ